MEFLLDTHTYTVTNTGVCNTLIPHVMNTYVYTNVVKDVSSGIRLPGFEAQLPCLRLHDVDRLLFTSFTSVFSSVRWKR